MITQFEAYKLKIELKRSGREFVFMRNQLNDFGEPDKEVQAEVIGSIIGLYHEGGSRDSSERTSIITGDTTQFRTKRAPAILCLTEDVPDLKVGDFVILNEKKYSINGILDVQQWGIISDISLEVFDNGKVYT